MSDIRNRLLVRTIAPASEPVTLAEAKLYLRIDHTSDDTLIGDMIVAARLSAEQWLKSSLISQSWKVAYDDYVEERVDLPMGPVSSITSVMIVARDGTTQTISNNLYYLNAARDAIVLDTPLFGTRIEITYATGYGSASQVPIAIKQGILAHVVTLYDERGSFEKVSIPSQSLALYSPFRGVKL